MLHGSLEKNGYRDAVPGAVGRAVGAESPSRVSDLLQDMKFLFSLQWLPPFHAADDVAEPCLHRFPLVARTELSPHLGFGLLLLQRSRVRLNREALFSVRSVFGRPRRFATRAAGGWFMAIYYRRFTGQPKCAPPLPEVPDDYHRQLTALRLRLRLSQTGLALQIGAAGKAVVYQWEARKRRPSPVLWQRVMSLQHHRNHGSLKYGFSFSPDSRD